MTPDEATYAPAHTLVVTHEPDHPRADNSGHRYEIVCEEVTDWCRAWQECLESQCDPEALEKAEEDGDEEPVVHGVIHRYVGNYGWSTEVPGCVLPMYDSWRDEARDLRLAPGEYRFTHRWEDGGEWFSIDLVEEAAR
ncbi:hypothetical protein ABT369_39295 [Dactylosporangium sp. NPDC000244]|uniref:hypothetical protein n=1 Tax=Dactylosporangium sp. NPDC000244 TaxID=3154365 RepID=UPI00331ED909